MKRPKNTREWNYRNLVPHQGFLYYERIVDGRRHRVNTHARPDTLEGWREAALYREVLDLYPDHHATLIALGEAQLAQDDIDGALVGGASLSAGSFAKIVKYR